MGGGGERERTVIWYSRFTLSSGFSSGGSCSEIPSSGIAVHRERNNKTINLQIQHHFTSKLTLHLDTGGMRDEPEVLKETSFDLVEVVKCVLIGHVGRADVKLEVWTKVLKVVVVGQF